MIREELLALLTLPMVLLQVVSRLEPVQLVHKESANAKALVWAATCTLALLILVGGDYRGITFSLEDLYLNRELISSSHGAWFEYIHHFVAKVLVPFLLISSIHEKKHAQFFVALILAAAMFFLTQHRATVLYPLMCLLVYGAICKFKRRLLPAMAMFTSLVIFIVLCLPQAPINILIQDFLVRRALVVPVSLQQAYIDFFKQNPFTHFSDTKIGLGLTQNPYNEAVPYIIGNYIGKPMAHANAGLVGSGFQQAGIVGVILYGLILALYVHILDIVTADEDAAVTASVAIPGFVWIIGSSDLPSVFFTHGFGIVAPLMLAYASRKREPNSKAR